MRTAGAMAPAPARRAAFERFDSINHPNQKRCNRCEQWRPLERYHSKPIAAGQVPIQQRYKDPCIDCLAEQARIKALQQTLEDHLRKAVVGARNRSADRGIAPEAELLSVRHALDQWLAQDGAPCTCVDYEEHKRRTSPSVLRQRLAAAPGCQDGAAPAAGSAGQPLACTGVRAARCALATCTRRIVWSAPSANHFRNMQQQVALSPPNGPETSDEEADGDEEGDGVHGATQRPSMDRIDASRENYPYVHADGRVNFRWLCDDCNRRKGRRVDIPAKLDRELSTVYHERNALQSRLRALERQPPGSGDDDCAAEQDPALAQLPVSGRALFFEEASLAQQLAAVQVQVRQQARVHTYKYADGMRCVECCIRMEHERTQREQQREQRRAQRREQRRATNAPPVSTTEPVSAPVEEGSHTKDDVQSSGVDGATTDADVVAALREQIAVLQHENAERARMCAEVYSDNRWQRLCERNNADTQRAYQHHLRAIASPPPRPERTLEPLDQQHATSDAVALVLESTRAPAESACGDAASPGGTDPAEPSSKRARTTLVEQPPAAAAPAETPAARALAVPVPRKRRRTARSARPGAEVASDRDDLTV